MHDTGATHYFICARLVAVLGLPLWGQPGLLSVVTAAALGLPLLGPAAGRAQGPWAPVLTRRRVPQSNVSLANKHGCGPNVGGNMILGWDWISSHYLQNLCM